MINSSGSKWRPTYFVSVCVCVCVCARACVLTGESRKAASYNPNLHNVNTSAEVIQIEDGHQEDLPNSKPN